MDAKGVYHEINGGRELLERSISNGVGCYFFVKQGLIGFGLNWGKPPDSGLDDQYTAEVLYGLQVAQNLSIRSLKACLHDLARIRPLYWEEH